MARGDENVIGLERQPVGLIGQRSVMLEQDTQSPFRLWPYQAVGRVEAADELDEGIARLGGDGIRAEHQA